MIGYGMLTTILELNLKFVTARIVNTNYNGRTIVVRYDWSKTVSDVEKLISSVKQTL